MTEQKKCTGPLEHNTEKHSNRLQTFAPDGGQKIHPRIHPRIHPTIHHPIHAMQRRAIDDRAPCPRQAAFDVGHILTHNLAHVLWDVRDFIRNNNNSEVIAAETAPRTKRSTF